MANEYLTVKEVSELLKITTTTTYKLFKTKGFPSKKIGGALRVNKEKLIQWIENEGIA